MARLTIAGARATPEGDAAEQRLSHLDPVDVRLIQELERDPRQSQSQLASTLNLSCPTVRARMARLRHEDHFRIVCIIDPNILGYTTCVIIGINAQPGELIAVSERLASLAPIYHLVLSLGRFDIIAWGLFRERRDYLDFLVTGIGRIPGITHVETMLTLRQVKLIGPLLSDRSHPPLASDRAVLLDPLESSLIRELQIDATQNTRKLAQKLGTSHSTVLRRIRRLEADGVIRFVAVANPFSLGYEVVASIGMTFEATKISEAAETLASYPHVRTVSICAGQYDIMAWTMFRRLDDLSDFIMAELSKIPGLQRSETMTNLRIVKASNQYLGEDAWMSGEVNG